MFIHDDQTPYCEPCHKAGSEVLATSTVLTYDEEACEYGMPMAVCAAHLEERVEAGDPEVPAEVAVEMLRGRFQADVVSGVLGS